MMKRIVKVMMSVMMVSILLTACGSKENEKEESVVKPREKLVLWSYYETQAQQKALDTLIEAFNQMQSQYEATWQYVPMTDFKKQLAMAVTEDELPDMVIIDNPDMKTYISLGVFEEITESVEANQWQKDVYNTLFEAAGDNGKYYGIPFCCNNLALIYNKKLFEEEQLSPPKDWNDFLDCARRLTDKDCYGFAMSAIEGEQSLFQMMPWILSTGEQVDQLGGKGSTKAFTLIETLIKEGCLDVNCINWSQNDIARKFIEGKAAMMENGPWVLPMLKEAGMEVGIVKLPVDKQQLMLTGGENLCIIKNKNKDGALAFLSYYSQPEVMQHFCQIASAIPTNREGAKAIKAEDPSYEVFVDQMEQCISRTTIKQWPQISQKLSESIYGLFIGKMTAEEASENLR